MDLLTVREAAQLLKVNPITVRRCIADGRLPAVRVGGGVRLDREAVERFIKPIEVELSGPRPPTPGGRAMTHEDPLSRLVGSVTPARPTDACKTHEYLAEALAPEPDE